MAKKRKLAKQYDTSSSNHTRSPYLQNLSSYLFYFVRFRGERQDTRIIHLCPEAWTFSLGKEPQVKKKKVTSKGHDARWWHWKQRGLRSYQGKHHQIQPNLLANTSAPQAIPVKAFISGRPRAEQPCLCPAALDTHRSSCPGPAPNLRNKAA